MKKMKAFSILLALILILGLLCGCGSSKSASYDAAVPSAPYMNNASTGASGGTGGWATEDMAMEEEKYDGSADMQNGSTQQTSAGLPENVKIIYTADIRMESTEFDATVRALDAMVSSMGGYYERNELTQYSSGYRNGYYTVRIPAEHFNAFCDGVSGICQVNNISRNAQDISEAYYDVESRLVTQQTKLERLQDLLKQAEDMEDIITLESAISETELAIEQLTGSLRKYDSLVGFSTITMSLSEVYKLSEQQEPAIGFGAKLAAAFKAGCSSFVRGLENFLLSVARGWIGWLIFLIFVAVAVIVPVRIVRKKKAAREKALNTREEPKE